MLQILDATHILSADRRQRVSSGLGSAAGGLEELRAGTHDSRCGFPLSTFALFGHFGLDVGVCWCCGSQTHRYASRLPRLSDYVGVELVCARACHDKL